MEFITDFEKNTNEYSTKIKDSIYLEKAKDVGVKGIKDICEVIIGANEIEYQTISASEKPKFVQDKKLDIASKVIKNTKHTKKFSESLIQNGFQSINHFSSILYLNELYKVNCIIYRILINTIDYKEENGEHFVTDFYYNDELESNEGSSQIHQKSDNLFSSDKLRMEDYSKKEQEIITYSKKYNL